ncbi:Lrp/AsnC family transcriptional regulator [Candidatus Woesearchaeota archaeon]|nr:Lrp/AsnC family transcriptional regulator [Candidatus Woesearchaeota archaeon]
MTYKLDLKDKKILYELSINSRQSFNELAKKTRLNKNSIAYRINNLQKVGIIKKFHALIDVTKLGYLVFKLSLNFQNTTPQKEKEIIDFLKAKDMVSWLASIEGSYNIEAIIISKSMVEINFLWEELMRNYANYLPNRKLTLVSRAFYFSNSYFLKKTNKHKTEFISKPEKVEIDNIDLKILQILCNDGRARVIDLASKLNLTPKTIITRIKELESKKVIVGYKPTIDIKNLDYTIYNMVFMLHNLSEEKRNGLKYYISEHPNIIYYYEKIGSDEDIDIELQVSGFLELKSILNDIKAKFSDVIREYRIMEISEKQKSRFIPLLKD